MAPSCAELRPSGAVEEGNLGRLWSTKDAPAAILIAAALAAIAPTVALALFAARVLVFACATKLGTISPGLHLLDDALITGEATDVRSWRSRRGAQAHEPNAHSYNRSKKRDAHSFLHDPAAAGVGHRAMQGHGPGSPVRCTLGHANGCLRSPFQRIRKIRWRIFRRECAREIISIFIPTLSTNASGSATGGVALSSDWLQRSGGCSVLLTFFNSEYGIPLARGAWTSQIHRCALGVRFCASRMAGANVEEDESKWLR